MNISKRQQCDILMDKKLTMKNVDNLWRIIQDFCGYDPDRLNCPNCIFESCIKKQFADIAMNYVQSVSKLCGIKEGIPFKLRHVTHDDLDRRKTFEREAFVLNKNGIFLHKYEDDLSLHYILDFLISGQYEAVEE